MKDKEFVNEKQFEFIFKNIQSNLIEAREKAVEYLENYYLTKQQIEKLTPYFTHNEWSKVSSFQHLNIDEEFIRSHVQDLIWLSVSFHWRYDINFTREMKDRLDWRPICAHNKPNYKFIREFYDYIKWHYIASFQTFSFNFVTQWSTELRNYISDIKENQKLTDEDKEKYIRYLMDYEDENN